MITAKQINFRLLESDIFVNQSPQEFNHWKNNLQTYRDDPTLNDYKFGIKRKVATVTGYILSGGKIHTPKGILSINPIGRDKENSFLLDNKVIGFNQAVSLVDSSYDQCYAV